VIDMIAQACQSLAEAHDAGLYHRDIKPPNLYLCRAADEVDIIKLLDFGIVQSINENPIKPVALKQVPQFETPKLTQLGAMQGRGVAGFIHLPYTTQFDAATKTRFAKVVEAAIQATVDSL
jgi:serine/threonine protein kinase